MEIESSKPELKDITTPEVSDAAADKTAAVRRGVGWITACLLILANVAITSLLIYGYDHYYAQKVAAVDLVSYIQKVKKGVVDGKLTEEQYKGSLDFLEAAIKSAPSNKVLISGDVFVGLKFRDIEQLSIVNPALEGIETENGGRDGK